MKYLVQNRKNLLFATLMAASFGLNAQIESTHTDVKYGYTTVVYKDKAASDTDVLSALDNSIGMGDVVRVTLAPPPVAVPKVDKSKGEDTWLKPATKPVLSTMTASTTANASINAVPASAAANVSAAPAVAAKPASASAALQANVAPVAVVKKSPAAAPAIVATKAAPVPAPVVAPVNDLSANSVAAAPVAVRTKSAAASNAYKSSNKSLKKGGKKGKSSFKMKRRKAGKQRYKCPKF